MKTLRVVVVTLGVLVLSGLGFVYSGAYGVAATGSDPALVSWVLETARRRSIERRAAALAVPPLEDPAQIRTGLVLYQEMCITCHGGPDLPASEVGQGLNPRAPLLVEAAGEPPAELFWVIRNGIRMTGMPAFGPTHTDEQIWALVAFLQKLPGFDAERYQAELAAAVGEARP